MGKNTAKATERAFGVKAIRAQKSLRIAGIILAVLVPPALVAGGAFWWMTSHRTGLDKCVHANTKSRLSCFQNLVQTRVDENGRANTVTYINAESKHNVVVRSYCHLAWHPSGLRDGKLVARNKEPLPYFRPKGWCDEGYLHGLIVGYATEAGIGASATGSAAAIQKLCTGSKSSHELQTCIHGAGHVYGRTLATQPQEMTRACNSLRPNSAWKFNVTGASATRLCFQGAYMEQMFSAAATHSKRYDNCTGKPDSGATQCWQLAAARTLTLGGSLQQAAHLCDTAPRSHKRACIRGFADSAPGPSSCNKLAKSGDQRACKETNVIDPVTGNGRD